MRSQPPWLMEEMIAAEPSLVAPILGSTTDATRIADQVRAAAAANAPIVVTGCGTSETAAMAVADLLTAALRRRQVTAPLVHARQALDAAQNPWPGGLCLGITHDGATRATLLAMEAARDAGGATGLITARGQSAAAAIADAVFTTPIADRSWCHTVGYLSPILAGAAIAEAIEPSGLDAAAFQEFVRDSLALGPQIATLAEALYGVDRLITAGAGADRSPARELALKIEEGVRLPARMLDLETVLHGHLAAADLRTGLIIVATGQPDRVAVRMHMVIDAARAIGLRVGAIVSPAIDRSAAARTDVSSVIIPNAVERHGLVGRLTGAALTLQQLTVSLTKLTRTSPDLIRREQQPYREAASAAERPSDW